MKKKIVRLTEDDLVRIVEKVVKEQIVATGEKSELETCITDILDGETIPVECTNCIENPSMDNKDNCKSCFNELTTNISFSDLGKLMTCFGKIGINFGNPSIKF